MHHDSPTTPDDGDGTEFNLYRRLLEVCDEWSDTLGLGPHKRPEDCIAAFNAAARLVSAEVFE